MTITELRNEYIAQKRALGSSKHTVKNYECDLKAFDNYMKEKNIIDVTSITRRDIQNFVIYLSDVKKNQPKSVHRKLSSIKNMFEHAMIEEYVDKTPVLGIKMPKIAKKLPVYMTKTEAKRFLDAAKDNLRDYTMIMTWLYTGIRVEEMVSLTKNDINFDIKILLIRGKGSKEREVGISSDIIKLIRKYLKQRNDDSEYLFISRNKTGMTTEAARNIVKKYKEKAKIKKNITPHKLRHTLATLLLQAGVETSTIKEILGHESIATTQIYAHVSKTQMRKSAKKNPLFSEEE